MRLIKSWILIPFKNRFIISGLVWQDIQGRFVGSMGGLLWSVMIPFANILIFIFIFSKVMKIKVPASEAGTASFVIFLLTGLIPWMAFSEALMRSTTILLEKASIITKVMFPVEVLPFVCVAVAFILNAAGFVFLLLYLSVRGYADVAWLLLPIAIFLHILFTLGLTSLMAALAVFIRDIQQLMIVILNLWMYATPIVYSLSMVPEPFNGLMMYNPIYSFIDLYRQILLHHSVSVVTWLLTGFWSTTSFSLGGWVFMRIKHAFGDVL